MDDHALDLTRRSLHAVAELVLAGPQYRASGTIKLIVEPTGFRTSTEPRLRVDGADLVAGGRRMPIDGATCVELASVAGVGAGAPQGLYDDGSGAAADEILRLDPSATRWIEECWVAGDAALRLLAHDEQPILWPEHFDVGILLDGVSYGVSPGDGYLGEPYAYVNPGPHGAGTFWNAPFGAARTMRELDAADPGAVHAFFAEGRRQAATG